MMDFTPAGLSTSKWIPGAASRLSKAPDPTGVGWATSGAPKPGQEEGPALPELCPGQQVPTGLKVGEGRRVECYLWLWRASCYF